MSASSNSSSAPLSSLETQLNDTESNKRQKLSSDSQFAVPLSAALPASITQCTAATAPLTWLHHIYSFLSFRHLHPSALTSKHWFNAAVQQPNRRVDLRLSISKCLSCFDAGSPLLRHIASVTLHNKHQPLTLSSLRSLTHLPNLRRLDAIFEVASSNRGGDEQARLEDIKNQLEEMKSGCLSQIECCVLDIVVVDLDAVDVVIPAVVRLMPNLVEVDFQCRGAELNDNDDEVKYKYQDLLPLTHLRKLTIHRKTGGPTAHILAMLDWRVLQQLPLTSITQGMEWSESDLQQLLREPNNLENLQFLDFDHTSFESEYHVKLLEPVWARLTSFNPLNIPVEAVPLLQNFSSLTSLKLCLITDGEELIETPESLVKLFSEGHMRSLKSLDLSTLMLEQSHVQQILDGCPQLEELQFTNCGFTGFPDLQICTQLRSLKFDANDLAPESADWIDQLDLDEFCKNVSRCPQLKKLEILGAIGDSLSEEQLELLKNTLNIEVEIGLESAGFADFGSTGTGGFGLPSYSF